MYWKHVHRIGSMCSCFRTCPYSVIRGPVLPVHDLLFQVYITLVDENDNPPVFNQPEYLQQIIETIPIYTHVLQVFANDADDGNNARLSFSKVPGSGDPQSTQRCPLLLLMCFISVVQDRHFNIGCLSYTR